MRTLTNSHAATVQLSLQRQQDQIASIAGPHRFEAFQNRTSISLKYRYFFCETPKVACSTIKQTLVRSELEDAGFTYSENRQIHIRELIPLLTPMMVPDISNRMKALFKFCFVRDPAVRLLSAYLDKIVRNKPQKRGVLKALKQANDLEYFVSFPDFVDFVCGLDPAQLDPHWSVQYHQVFADKIQYDFIGRFERFEEDFKAVLSHLAIDPKYFQSAMSHRTDSARLQSEYLTPALRRKIENRYSIDYEKFDY